MYNHLVNIQAILRDTGFVTQSKYVMSNQQENFNLCMTSSIISFSTWSAVLGQYLLTSSLLWLTVFFNPHARMHKFSRKNRTIKMVSVIKCWRVFVVSHGQRTCFNAGITGMTCRDVAETSLSDLAGLAQYCSRRARLQLLKQHSSTIPRFWERRLFDLLVGRPAEIQMKIMSSRHFRIFRLHFRLNH